MTRNQKCISKKKHRPKMKRVLPDLEQIKASVLSSLRSPESRRSYNHSVGEFVAWYCSEPRLSFNRTIVTRYRIHLETRQLAPGTVNVRLAAVRRLAYEAADAGLLSPEFAAGIRRVKGAKPLGIRLGNGLTGLAVSFSSPTPSVCALSGATVTLTGVGACTIQATQAGNSNYSAATPVSQSFQVTQASQTITFGPLTNRPYSTATFTVSASVSSGLTVSFGSQTAGVCTVSGTTVKLVAVGTCTIQATQAGNANYAAAPPVNQSFQVTQASQTITFGALSNKTYGAAPFTESATSTSGLAVGFNSQTSGVCSISGSTVTLVGAGTCTIQATQAGNANFAPATPVSRSFQVAKASQTISFAKLSTHRINNGPFAISAAASSGRAVSFASTTTTICGVSGTTVTLMAQGSCTIQASQGGNANYLAATPVRQSFPVNR